MTLAFLSSYLAYRPTVEPEAFDVCPILLTRARRGPLDATAS